MLKDLLPNLNTHQYLLPVLAVVFIVSFIISYYTFKPLLTIIIKRRLHDEPNSRSAHSKNTPTIGGVAIYLSFVLVICLFGALLKIDGLLIVIFCLTWLFFTGISDDLNELKPINKAIIQLIVSLLIVVVTDVRIIGFSGILGIGVLPDVVSVVFTVFVYLLVINAFNLIDGVDGLAAGIALLACTALSFLFWKARMYSYVALCFSLTGTLLPFLWFNVFNKRKIFMGDSGSMIIGFIVAFCVVSFISKSQANSYSRFYFNAPILAVAVLFYPLIDTLRIFFIRFFINKTSPFKADKNHIHHKFLQLGYSHKKTSATIIFINGLVFLLALSIASLDINLQLIIIIFGGVLLYLTPFILHRILHEKPKKVS